MSDVLAGRVYDNTYASGPGIVGEQPSAALPAPEPVPSASGPEADGPSLDGLRRRRLPLVPLLIGVLVIGLAIGGLVIWLQLPTREVAALPASGQPQVTRNPAQVPPASEASSSTQPSTSAGPTISTGKQKRQAEKLKQKRAHAELERLADEGIASISLDGQNAAMMASKWVGIRDPLQTTSSGKHVFGYTDILAEHDALESGDNMGATVILIRSTDYGRRTTSPSGKVLYVTMALGGFSSPNDVQSWCDRRFANLTAKQRNNTCVPTRLTR